MTLPLHIFLTRKFRSFRETDSGAMAVWAAAALPVLLGGAALSVDVARLYNMDQDLQSAADAFSKAGAAELDQRKDSLIRANRAISTLVENEQKFASDGRATVRVASMRFLKSIPDKDYEDIAPDQVTTDPAQARFVEVEVAPERVSTLFPQGAVKSITSIELEAVSTAGFSQDICGVAPVFVCNPFEDSSATTIYDAMEDPSFRRRLVRFKTQGPNARYGPGNFGYLDPFDGNSGASLIRNAIAIDTPNVCLSKTRGVKLRPGNINSVSQAFNVRFDMYDGAFSKAKSDPAFAPAANVIKGHSARGNNACNSSPDPDAFAMPRDSNFGDSTGASSPASESFGNGDWDFVEYMRINHNYRPSVTIAGVTYMMDYGGGTSSPAAPPSRYDLYRWEIETDSIPGAMTYGNNAVTPEEGIPQCHTGGAHPDPDIDRRVFNVAVLNCGAIESEGDMNGRTDSLPVETFVKVFMTEPMGSGSDNTLYGEIIGPVVQGEDISARDQVAVVR